MFEMIHPDKASDKTMENFETMKHLQISNFYIDKKNIFYIEVLWSLIRFLLFLLLLNSHSIESKSYFHLKCEQSKQSTYFF